MKPCVCLLPVMLLLLAVLTSGGTVSPARAQEPSFYPGIFPAMTPAYAAQVQHTVDAGQRRWLLDPAQVGLAFARFVHWGRPQSATVIRRGGGTALIAISSRSVPRARLLVQEAQLGRGRTGIWSVTGCFMNDLRIVSPPSGQRAASPLHVRGSVRVFEGTFTLRVLDVRWQQLGIKRVTGPANYRGPAPFAYSVRFRPRGRYALVEAFALSPRDGSLALLSMVKVMLRS